MKGIKITDIISKKTYKYWTNAVTQKKKIKKKIKVMLIGRKGTLTNTSRCYLKSY